MEEEVSIQDVANSLARVCTQHPAAGVDSTLHPDASLLAELYGLMIYSKASASRLADIDPEVLAALERWRVERT